MNKLIITTLSAIAFGSAFAQQSPQVVTSPDGRLQVTVSFKSGAPFYSVNYDGQTVLLPSPLGLVANYGDFSSHMSFAAAASIDTLQGHYTMDRGKFSEIAYKYTTMVCPMQNSKEQKIDVEFRVGNNDIALRYRLPRDGETGSAVVLGEMTGFRFPSSAKAEEQKKDSAWSTSTFLTPQSEAMIGWKRTKPSYEEEYRYDAPMEEVSKFKKGYTFPCLFHEQRTLGTGKKAKHENIWVLISETGVDSRYCASRLSDGAMYISEDPDIDGSAVYSIAYPMPEENNGNGTTAPGFALPGNTPWRTITVSKELAPVVETTVMWDLVEPRYKSEHKYKYGRGAWSWILWQDESINYEDQVKYVDFASAMGYEYVLVDNWWDTRIGRAKIEELVKYARSKNVDVFLWYSSSGYWNDIVQGPTGMMDNSINRKKEMKWMRNLGVKGIKVDFFGGDKQETMRLYEEILSDADDHGLMVIFHGCTVPRGWERMYPNYVGSEAVLASENLYFDQHFCDAEAVNACTHPFIRNAQGCMEWGGCFMNHRISRDNQSRNERRTTDVFELATTILFQNPIQNFALAPNNLFGDAEGKTDIPGSPAPQVCLDYLKAVPTTWDETRLLDGYPGEYIALARRHGDRWYIAVVNAHEDPIKLTLNLSALSSTQQWQLISGGDAPVVSAPKLKKGTVTLTIAPTDGVVIY